MKTIVKPAFTINGSTIKVLRYARFRKRPVTPEELKAFFPHFFKRPYRAREAMQRLETYNFLSKVGEDSWNITSEGVAYLYATAPKFQGEH